MYILRYRGLEIKLTDIEFRELARWYLRGFRPLTQYREFCRPIWQREAPDIPLITFMAWLAAAYEYGYWEYAPEIKMIRVQWAVLYYYSEQKRHTPNPFMEARAWIVCPESEANYWRRKLNTEAWYIPTLFASIYDCWESGNLMMIREGYEEREVEESQTEPQRAVAFYKEGEDIWEAPAYFYDEEYIRMLEDILFPCIQNMGFSIDEFKETTADLHHTAAELLEQGQYESAIEYMREIQYYMAACGVLGYPLWGGRR